MFVHRPVWYSWSEARKPGNEASTFQYDVGRAQHTPYVGSAGYHGTILDVSEGVTACLQHPSSGEVHVLWEAYVTNVHPLVKLFFDWNKEPILHRAASDPADLSVGEQAFCFSTYFIAALSLSEEECKAKLNCPARSLLLDEFQFKAEAALIAAKYASTGEVIVLQAYLIYLVR